MTNYINADGTSSDCCIYREIAPRSSPSPPSFGVQRPAPYQRTKQVPDAYGRRRKARRSKFEREEGTRWIHRAKMRGRRNTLAKGTDDYWAPKPRITGITPGICNRAPGRQSATDFAVLLPPFLLFQLSIALPPVPFSLFCLLTIVDLPPFHPRRLSPKLSSPPARLNAKP